MKVFIIFKLLKMIKFHLVFLILLFCKINLFAQPVLEFENGNKYDWGNVKPEDSPLKADIKVWNKGDDTLKILDIKPSCGCTVAPIDKNIILPNEFATISLKFSVESSVGVINKMINIRTNIPDKPYIVYFLIANVQRDLTFEGVNYFNYGSIRKGLISERSVNIKNNTDKDIKISKIYDLPEYCTLNIKEGSIVPGNSIINIIASVQNFVPGNFSFAFKIQTENSKIYDLVISGWGNIVECADSK